jgi:hypothetical protein
MSSLPGSLSSFTFLLEFVFVFVQGGFFVLTLLNTFAVDMPLIVVGFLEVTVIAWIYGWIDLFESNFIRNSCLTNTNELNKRQRTAYKRCRIDGWPEV